MFSPSLVFSSLLSFHLMFYALSTSPSVTFPHCPPLALYLTFFTYLFHSYSLLSVHLFFFSASPSRSLTVRFSCCLTFSHLQNVFRVHLKRLHSIPTVSSFFFFFYYFRMTVTEAVKVLFLSPLWEFWMVFSCVRWRPRCALWTVRWNTDAPWRPVQTH